jgi:hypothetical protein
MSAVGTLLPAGFEALTRFVRFWAVDSAAERAHCRDLSDEAGRAEFYQAASQLVPKALDYLDAKPLGQFDESEQRLMKLILSFAHVSMAVELQREQEPQHAKDRPSMRITRATADQPVG